jgi:hypothetical protein
VACADAGGQADPRLSQSENAQRVLQWMRENIASWSARAEQHAVSAAAAAAADSKQTRARGALRARVMRAAQGSFRSGVPSLKALRLKKTALDGAPPPPRAPWLVAG